MIGRFFKIGICIAIVGVCFYLYIEQQNDLTKLKIKLPKLVKEVSQIEEKNKKLQYEIDLFENPNNLLELVRMPEYLHLRHPLVNEVLSIPEGMALKENTKYITTPIESKVQ